MDRRGNLRTSLWAFLGSSHGHFPIFLTKLNRENNQIDNDKKTQVAALINILHLMSLAKCPLSVPR